MSHFRNIFTPYLVATLLIVGGACEYDVGLGPWPESDVLSEQSPQEDEWRVVTDAELASDVELIQIGGREFEGNFANRGDIEVHFDGEEDRIRVEMRRFSFGPSADTEEAGFDNLWLWAFAGESLAAPTQAMLPNACDVTWRDGCELRVYYDGQIQPLRTGADLRVTLPSSFDGHLRLVTEDSLAEAEFPRRSDVRVVGLPGTAEIELEDGVVEVSLAKEVLPAPACGLEKNQSCAGWEEEGEVAPWALACGCTDFGRVLVEGANADVTVEMPASLWSTVAIENLRPSNGDEACDVEIDCDSFETCDVIVDDPLIPGKKRYELNDPGDDAISGAGYQVQVKVDACANISHADEPGDFGAPSTSRRGDVRICSDCLE